MPFVKLDTRILDSTLWVERDAREVFITALLLAEPKEFLSPIPQIAVRSLESTGFVAAPGWYGFVPAAGVGIIRRALVEQEAGFRALEELGAEDPESRSSEHGGRRLIRIDGGYLVLNFIKYRDKDHTTAERSRRYRESRKSRRDDVTVTRDATACNRDITEAEAEAEAYLSTTTPTPSKLVACGKPKQLTPQPPIRGADQSKLKSKDKTQNLTIAGTDLTFWRQQFHVIMRQVRDALYTASENLGTKGKPGMSDGYADWKMYFDDIQVAEFSADEVTAVPVLMIEAEDPNLAQQGMSKYDTRIRRAMVDVLGQEIHLRLQARNVGYHY